MRICMVYQGEFPPAERIEKTARSLREAGHEVFLLCNTYGNGRRAEEQVGDVRTLRLRPMLPGRAVSKIVKFPIFVNPLWIAQLAAAVRRFRIEALHVIDLPLSPAAIVLARSFGIPVVYDMWENYPEALRGWSKTNWKTRVFKNHGVAHIVERWAVRRVDHLFTVVEEARDRVLRLGAPPARVSVVTNGVDPEMFDGGARATALDREPQAYKLLFVGALTVERGLDDVIRALPLVRPQIPEVRLFIAGTGNDQPRLQEISEREGVADLVRFLGWVRFADIQSHILASDLCLVPHVYNEFINTTVPNKLFQYMISGKPVLVSHAKPLARIVSECSCGYVFRSGDPADAARKIIAAYGNRPDTEAGLRGKRCAEQRYTWAAAARALVSVYDELDRRRPT